MHQRNVSVYLVITLMVSVIVAGCTTNAPATPIASPVAGVRPTPTSTSERPLASAPTTLPSPIPERPSAEIRVGIWMIDPAAAEQWAKRFMHDSPTVLIRIIDKRNVLDRLGESGSSATSLDDLAALVIDDVDVIIGIPAALATALPADRLCPPSVWLSQEHYPDMYAESLVRAFPNDPSPILAPLSVEAPLLSLRSDDGQRQPLDSWSNIVALTRTQASIASMGGIDTIWLGLITERVQALAESPDAELLNRDPYRTATLQLHRAIRDGAIVLGRGASVISQTVIWSDFDAPSWRETPPNGIRRIPFPNGVVADMQIEVFGIGVATPCPPLDSPILEAARSILRDVDLASSAGQRTALRAIPAAPVTRAAWQRDRQVNDEEYAAYEQTISRYDARQVPESWRLLSRIVADELVTTRSRSDDDVIRTIQARWEEMRSYTPLD